jgi:hypothetical protein
LPEEVEELPTLTPIDSPAGLTPLGGAPAGVLLPLGGTGGLTPLGPAPGGGFGAFPSVPSGGLTPLGADPFGGMPSMGSDPLAGMPAANMSGHALGPSAAVFASAAANPYSSPVGGGYSSAFAGVSDAGRKGLPWERSADMESLQDTAMLILGEPQNAFMQMRRSGGIMNSMAFWIVSLIIGNTVSVVYLTILGAIGLAINGAPAESYGGLAVMAVIYVVAGVLQAVILGPVGAFIGAAFWHVVLLVFGCARGGFEATFRAQCFVIGAVALLNIIPIVGWLVGIFYQIALLIHAFTHAHEVSGGRVTAAVLTVYGLLCCCFAPLFAVPLLQFISRLAAGGPL